MKKLIEKKKLKPYHGVLVLILVLCDMMFLPFVLPRFLGFYGTIIVEGMFVVLSVAVVLLARVDLREVFPVRMPKTGKVFGTLLLWVGTFLAAEIVVLCISYFFPEKVFEASQGISAGMESVPFMMAAFIIAVTPAICEEAVFRGVFLNSLMGRWNKWIPILITGIVFGMFHGSVVRFFPTAILGIVMGYIVVETGNIFYSMLFHFVNNLFPVLLTQLLEISSQGIETEAEIMMMEIPLASVGMYMCIGVAAPFLIYIGNYLLHKGEEGHSDKLFPRQKRISLILLSGISAVLFIFGGILCVIGMSYMMQYVQLY